MRSLTVPEKHRYDAAKIICKALSNETSVIAKTLSRVNIKNIPDSIEPAIRNWIRKYKGKSEVYGSGAMATHSTIARRPQDLDIVIDNPSHAAHALSQLIKRKGIKTKIIANLTWNSYVLQIYKDKQWYDAIDIHPIKDHHGKYDFYGSSKPPTNKKGINLQQASDQLLRKANAITQRKKDGSMGASPHRELKDTTDFISTTELLLASMEVKSKAQQAKAKQVRAALKTWKSYALKVKGYKTADKRKPLSKSHKKKFIAGAIKHSDTDVNDLIFEKDKIIIREKIIKHKNKHGKKDPYKRMRKSNDNLIDIINNAYR
jgi:hypothetical protein